ncbi:MAG: MFS transporter [Candidatus Obscuribacterales bacterium]|jgi:MFS family permease|nr:MFS transporter [Candidatus Obscuribacterales bacterium]
MSGVPVATKFVRDELCWLVYLMIGNYCYLAAGMGPAMNLLSSELHLSYSIAALHFSAWSLGVLSAGTFGERIMKKFGKPSAAWMAGTALCGGILVFLSGVHPVVTILGCLICGFNGSVMCQSLCTIMADRFAEARVIAISESNFVASIFCSLAPFLIGTCFRSGLNWRIAIVLPIVLFLVFFMVGRPIIAGAYETSPKGVQADGKLPPFYWLCWLLAMFSVASEWSIIFWGADFLEKVTKLSKADATTSLTAFLVAMVVARFIGSRLVRAYPTKLLLRCTSILALCGFLVFWLGHSVYANMTGLVLAGLGIANFYPLTLSAAIGSAPEQAGKATSRMSIATGGATLCAPLLLGIFAEHSNIFSAYGLVVGLLSICCVIAFLSKWQSRSYTTDV